MNLYLLADYGSGDLAWAEVEAALREELPALRSLVRVELPPFDTWACSLALAQIAERAGSRDIVFHNVAPRRDNTAARGNNEGEPLLAGHGPSGTLLVGPGSGYSWSLCQTRNLRKVECSSGGSQFRSRDIFPAAIGKLYRGQGNIWGEKAEDPPALPPGRVLLTDGYGNLKTSLRVEGEEGSRVTLSCRGREAQATITGGAFEVGEGELALAPGSSGDRWEVFLRGGSAAELLGFPPGGEEILVR